MNSNDLTIEEQKLLTEFLSECYHEYKGTTDTHYGKCNKCGLTEGYASLPEYARLDFSDWRVVGRLVEKVGRLECLDTNSAGMWFCKVTINQKYKGVSTPQLAICRAVLSFLKEKE